MITSLLLKFNHHIFTQQYREIEIQIYFSPLLHFLKYLFIYLFDCARS